MSSESHSKINLIDESDRGAVIVAASLLEAVLDEVLLAEIKTNNVSKKNIDLMFEVNGPLSSFSAKILVCYGFGLISAEVFDDLNKIRKFRNKLAHSSYPVDFLSSEIENMVSSIACCVAASKKFEGSILSGRKRSGTSEPLQVPDWKLRSEGFVKYTKSVFCLGVQILEYQIRLYQVNRLLNADGGKDHT